jgi:ankyrin repeat protein
MVRIRRALSILGFALVVGWSAAAAMASPADDLFNAARRNDTATVQALLGSGAEINATNGQSRTALFLASQNGYFEVVQALLAKGAAVNVRDTAGATALIVASQNGHLDVVQALLTKGAEVNTKTREEPGVPGTLY